MRTLLEACLMEMEVLPHILVGLGIQDMFPEPFNGHWLARAMICF